MKGALLVAALVALQGTDGQVTVWVNPEQVISIRAPRGIGRHWPAGTRCLVLTTDGKFFTTSQDCGSVRRALDKE